MQAFHARQAGRSSPGRNTPTPAITPEAVLAATTDALEESPIEWDSVGQFMDTARRITAKIMEGLEL